MKKIKITSVLLFLISTAVNAGTATVGTDILYVVKSKTGTTQDWGTIDPTTGTFTAIKQISPTGLGWPMGDIGSQPDPVNGYVFSRQGNNILAIKKSDGTTKWLGVDGSVVGYDTKNNRLILRNYVNSKNNLISYDILTETTSTLLADFANGQNSWQAGGIGGIDSFGRTAFQLNSSNKLYKVNLDTGAETIITLASNVVTISWDSKQQKLYGIYNDGSGMRIAGINTSTGALTNISGINSINGIGNYVQMIAPNDQRYYVQENGSVIRVISLEDGSSLGTFTAPLRLMPVGAVVMGADNTTKETVTFDINDPDSTIVKKGTNEVTYTGTNSSTGDVDIEGGTLKVATTDNLGTGKVSLEGGELEISTDTTVTNEISSSDDDSAIDTGTNSVTVSGIISGSNEINKSGTGTLTLTGSLNNTGGFDVTGGTLITNGTGVTPVTVTSGTLQGSGTIGSLTSNSFVAPGNSIGTLNVAGNVTLNSGSTLVIEVNANGTSDKIIATGSASLGGTLRVSPEPGTYTAGSQYTFITASNVSGTFSSVVLLSCGSGDTASTTYAANSVTVTLSGCLTVTTNSSILKSYINDLSSGASGDLSTVITALNTLSGAAYNKAVNQLDHDNTGAVASVGQQQLSQLNTVIEQRVETVSSPKNFFMANPADLATTSSWGQVYGASGTKKALSDLGINGYDYSFSGVTIGSDYLVGQDTYGAAVSIMNGEVTNNASEGKTNYNSLALTGYMSQDKKNGSKLRTTLSIVTNFLKSKRYLKFGSVDRTASASYNSFAVDLGLDYSLKPSDLVGGILTTTLKSGLTSNYQEGFTEVGADSLNLKVNSNTSGIFRLGASQTYVLKNENNTYGLIPYLNWGLNNSIYLSSPTSVQALQNQTAFTTKSDKRSDTYGQIGFGLTKETGKNEEFVFSAARKFSGSLSENSVLLQYKKYF